MTPNLLSFPLLVLVAAAGAAQTTDVHPTRPPASRVADPIAVTRVRADATASLPLPPGTYLLDAMGSWSANAVDWVNAVGDATQVLDHAGLVTNRGRLLVFDRGRWCPWRQGMVIEHGGGVLRLRMHDDVVGDNLGCVTITLSGVVATPH